MDEKINLDAAAIPDSNDEGSETSTEGSQPEQKAETEESTESEESSSSQKDVVEESRVPYSRFKTVNDEKETAMERAIRAETELEVMRRQSSVTSNGELPDYWVELYGDSDISKRAWGAEQKRLAVIEEGAAKRAVEGLQKQQREQAKQEEQAVANMENAFDDYAGKNKRNFSDTETSAILDIMDELSPKDEYGNYEVDPVRYLERAVEIHDLRQVKSTSARNVAKRRAASLTGASSDGEPSNEKVGHFQPGSWDSWRNNPILPKDN